MTRIVTLTIALLIFALASPSALAGSTDHMKDHATVIALSMDDFELAETDISNMEPGDVETIYSESGKRVDLLRTEDGVEIYVDGELVNAGMHGGGEGHHGHGVEQVIVIRKEVDSD